MRKEFYNCLFMNVVIGKVVRRERKMLQFAMSVAVCNTKGGRCRGVVEAYQVRG